MTARDAEMSAPLASVSTRMRRNLSEGQRKVQDVDDAECEVRILTALADEVRRAYDDGHNEAAGLADWPADGCSQGCAACFARWLRARAARVAATQPTTSGS